MTSVPNNTMTPQECKQYAMQLVSRAWTLPHEAEDRASLLAEAQVWATLATVPNELTANIDEMEQRATALVTMFPKLECPHGLRLPLEQQDDGSLRYSHAGSGCWRCQ